MTQSANLGFPRIGARRELKRALEAHWRGETSEDDLRRTGADLRSRHWRLQRDAGIDVIPSNDFSYYDHVLDTAAMLSCVPDRFGPDGGPVDLAAVFAMARGTDAAPACEMTKWFDTNYHYIVPELVRDQRFALGTTKPVDEYLEAKALGIETRPVLLGPVTFLVLAKAKTDGLDPLSLLEGILPIYEDVLSRLAAAGAAWVQIDEPALVSDLPASTRGAFRDAYDRLADAGPKVMLTTYFGGLGDNLDVTDTLPVAGLHVDLVRAPGQLGDVVRATGDKTLSLGLVDGRNVWRTDLPSAFRLAEQARDVVGADRLQVAPSCSLLHSPVDLDQETTLDPELRSWMAFGAQKLAEVRALGVALAEGREAATEAFAASEAARASRIASPRTRNEAVREQADAVSTADLSRPSPYAVRAARQGARLRLPEVPTTTIGSFPQTPEVRRARADRRAGRITQDAYAGFLRRETEETIRRQEALGLDMLVHGEFERNDMVEYFGEKLDGFGFTKLGWVQSYGSRCVKPPVLYGDVSRTASMTTEWSAYAQSLTDRPVKGMLTGPVTILQWSFVRDDQPRAETAKQIALAIRDEVADLEAAGLAAIQVDEPALREGLPLRQADRTDYLVWAADAFRLATAGARDETQIHTHMCYAEFEDIMETIARLDADVISIEASRSGMQILDAFEHFAYPNAVGPGVWDIHAPRVPSQQDMERLLRKALRVLPKGRLWANPDCGLKTRRWEEVEPSLRHLVGAAKAVRAQP